MVEVLSSRILLRPVDFAATLAFYRDVLGLQVYREYGVDGRRTGVVLFAGGGFVEVTSNPPRHGDVAGADDLWLQVPDLSAACDELRARGVAFEQPPRRMPWGLDEAWLRDPDGRHVALVEVPEGHPIRTRLE